MHPTLFSGSDFEIPTYFLILSLTVCLCAVWLYKRTVKRNLPLKGVLDLGTIVVVFGFLGARLFHIFYEEPAYYFAEPLRVFYFWQGGFVYYGGAIAGILAGVTHYLWILKLPRQEVRTYLDLFAPVASFGYLLGRIGCFMAGCCYGKSCDLPWAIGGRHPTQLYAVFWELGTLIILSSFEKSRPTPGKVFFGWLMLHGIGRMVMEIFRDDFRGPSIGLSISSWLSLALIIIGMFGWKQTQTSLFFKGNK